MKRFDDSGGIDFSQESNSGVLYESNGANLPG